MDSFQKYYFNNLFNDNNYLCFRISANMIYTHTAVIIFFSKNECVNVLASVLFFV